MALAQLGRTGDLRTPHVAGLRSAIDHDEFASTAEQKSANRSPHLKPSVTSWSSRWKPQGW